MTTRESAAHCAVVAAIIGASYGMGIARVEFFPDESQWIATSYYLEALLGEPVEELRQDVPRPLWAESKQTLTQPPLARYVIGFGRRAGGFGVADLNGEWDFNLDARANETAGNRPTERLLLWSRLPMAILSILSGLLLFAIAWRCAGLLTGYVFALGFAFNPYLLQTLRRAMGEATLTFFVVLALLATERGVRAFQTFDADAGTRAGLRLFAWWLVAGLCCGLAGAAKLNGLLATVGAALAAWVAGRTAAMVDWRRTAAAVGILFVATFVAFAAPNPYLHPDPVWRMVKMWQFRVDVMHRQQSYFPDVRLDRITQRVETAARRVLSEHAILRFRRAWIINGAFSFAGFLVLARQALRSVRQRRPGMALVVLALGGTLVVPAIFSPLDWDRYYLFPVLFGGLCLAAGVSTVTDLALTRARWST